MKTWTALFLMLLMGACADAPEPTSVSAAGREVDPEIFRLVRSFPSWHEMRVLINKAPDQIRARDAGRRTALHYASGECELEVVQLLVEAGADVDAVSADYATPLVFAAGHGKGETVRYLLAKGARVEGAPPGATPLQSASSCHFGDVIKTLIEAGAVYDLKSAVLLSDEEQVRSILTTAPRDHDWKLPIRRDSLLNLACGRGRLGIVSLLYERFPFPNEVPPAPGDVSRPSEPPPLWFALAHPDVVKFLLGKGADAKFPGLVFGAVLEGCVDSARMLIERGADVNARCGDKVPLGLKAPPGDFTPLHWAAENGQLEIVKLLISSKADVNATCRWGTPLSLAKGRFPGTDPEGDEIKKVLRDAGAR